MQTKQTALVQEFIEKYNFNNSLTNMMKFVVVEESGWSNLTVSLLSNFQTLDHMVCLHQVFIF